MHCPGKNYIGDNVNVLMQMVRACQDMTVVIPDERMKQFGQRKKGKPFEDQSSTICERLFVPIGLILIGVV